MKIRILLISVFAIFNYSCNSEEAIVSFSLSTLASPSEGGKINITPGSSSYKEGDVVSLSAVPNPNWVFKQWEGDASGTANPLSINMVANTSIIGVFEKREYPLTLNIIGEGTVSEEVISNLAGKDYVFGTQVQLTAIAAEDWEFESWEGDANSAESVITVSVDGPKTITVNFIPQNPAAYYQISRLRFDNQFAALLPNLPATFYGPPANFHYEANGQDFFLFPGTTPQLSAPTPSITLKKIGDEWVLHKLHYDAEMNQPRNYKILDEDEFVIGDSNEHGPSPWRGNLWYGKIKSDGDIDWIRINSDEDKAFYHGITGGDLNKDGLYDFGGVPSDPEYKVFLQQQDGSFSKQNSIWNMDFVYSVNPEVSVGIPFTLDFSDIIGDERDEIITADYGGGNPLEDPSVNHVAVYTFNEESQAFELYSRTSEPSILPIGLGATSIIVADFNNDTVKDIAVAREEGSIDIPYNSIEVWLGNGDGTFASSYSKIWALGELQFREFSVMDANQDGFEDIILRSNNGTKYWTGELNQDGAPYQDGISLNNSILINLGNGVFEPYAAKDLSFRQSDGYSSVPHNLNPFLKNGKLCFVGARNLNDPTNDGYFDVDIIEICVDLR